MDPAVTVLAFLTFAQAARLGSLALQLHCNARRQRHQLDTLTALATRVSSDVLIELDAGHGGRLRLRTSTKPFRQERHVRG